MGQPDSITVSCWTPAALAALTAQRLSVKQLASTDHFKVFIDKVKKMGS